MQLHETDMQRKHGNTWQVGREASNIFFLPLESFGGTSVLRAQTELTVLNAQALTVLQVQCIFLVTFSSLSLSEQ